MDSMGGLLDRLELGQQRLAAEVASIQTDVKILKKDVTTIKKEVRAVWDDIRRLDNRISIQEGRAVN